MVCSIGDKERKTIIEKRERKIKSILKCAVKMANGKERTFFSFFFFLPHMKQTYMLRKRERCGLERDCIVLKQIQAIMIIF